LFDDASYLNNNENINPARPAKSHHHTHRNNHHHKNKKSNDHAKKMILNCLTFPLDSHKEFDRLYIKTADIFLKLEFDLIKKLLAYVNKALEQHGGSDNDNYGGDIDEDGLSNEPINSYLYLEVNGHLVKMFDVLKISQEQKFDFQNFVKEPIVSLSDSSLFESANVKSIIEDELFNNASLLRVKLFFKNERLNSLQPRKIQLLKERIVDLFSHIDEYIALHVKFDGEIPLNSQVNGKIKRSGGRKSRSKNGHNGHSSGGKKLRNCAELRKHGYTNTNFTCCRETITFSMDQIGWSHWILSPKVIEYKYCRGGCSSGTAHAFDNTVIVHRMFEMSQGIDSTHCCNIYDYEDDIPFIYGTPPNYNTKMISLNAKNCLCS
jgi:hypothetical protein